MDRGKLIVITGPSGVGKDSLVKELVNQYPDIYLSISTTTRPPREGEVDGLHYHFTIHAKFNEAINKGEFLEWVEYGGNLYGASVEPIKDCFSKGQSVLLILEVVGANKVKSLYPSTILVFITPPSIEELEKRIRNRNLDSEEAIKSRMERGLIEIEEAHKFDYVIVNDDFDKALSELSGIVKEVIF